MSSEIKYDAAFMKNRYTIGGRDRSVLRAVLSSDCTLWWLHSVSQRESESEKYVVHLSLSLSYLQSRTRIREVNLHPSPPQCVCARFSSDKRNRACACVVCVCPVSDYVFIVAAAVIIGNIFSILVLQTRLF